MAITNSPPPTTKPVIPTSDDTCTYQKINHQGLGPVSRFRYSAGIQLIGLSSMISPVILKPRHEGSSAHYVTKPHAIPNGVTGIWFNTVSGPFQILGSNQRDESCCANYMEGLSKPIFGFKPRGHD